MISCPYQCKLQAKQCNYYSSKSSLPFFFCHIRCLRTEKVRDGIRLSNIGHLRHLWLVHLSTFHPPKESYLYIGFSYIGFIVLTLFTFPRGTPVISGMSLYSANDSDFKPVPYTKLAPCERKPQGDINCPDIRRNGTARLRQAQLVLTRIPRIFDLIATPVN